MSNKNILVTSYQDPDLDGFSSAYAYAEFLSKKNKDIEVQCGFFGNIHRETEFVLQFESIKKLNNPRDILKTNPDIILTDASTLSGLTKEINPNQVIELIDHRKAHEAEKFLNAKLQIELVGAAATLIAEKFYKKNIDISPESALLLYSAIISNTINFHNNVTTDRDKKMANYLQSFFKVPDTYIYDMFEYKSDVDRPIEELIGYAYPVEVNGKTLGLAQLEIVRVGDFLNSKKDEIKVRLSKIKEEDKLDAIMLSCIDLEEYSSTFISFDDFTKVLENIFPNLVFRDGVAVRDNIIMRKELIPLILKK